MVSTSTAKPVTVLKHTYSRRSKGLWPGNAIAPSTPPSLSHDDDFISERERRPPSPYGQTSHPAFAHAALEVLERISMAMKLRLTTNHDLDGDPGWTVTATFMEWLRTIIIKKWESKAEVNKWSSIGTAVMILDKLRKLPGGL